MGVRSRTSRRKGQATPWVKALKRVFVAFFMVLLIGVPCVLAYVMSTVRAVEPLVENVSEKIQTYNSKPSQILTADGKLLYEVKPVIRESISLSEVPKQVQQAFLAAEDKRFWEHSGVDPIGLMRASLNLVKAGGVNGGGSTITMQLAKRLFSASQVTMQRKVQDISIAIQLEKKYTKEQILELYLNQVFYGEQAYGIAAACQIYFGKKVSELTLAEAAMLARCVRLPSTENPVKNYQKANENKIIVLRTMLEEGWITQSEFDEAKAEKPKVRKRAPLGGGRIYAAPYFTAMVLQELRQKGIELNEGGYLVTTTLDSQLQAEAEKAVENRIRWNRGRGVNTAAFLAIDSEGRILVDVGGVNFRQNRLSRTSQGDGLQPGSAFKPFVYAEAIKEGLLGEYSTVSNEKLTIKGYGAGGKGYTPRNSHGGYGGRYSLRTALAQSLNVPAVRTFQELGFKRGADLISEDFGFDRDDIQGVPSTALGTCQVKMTEVAEAYSVFMLNGKRVTPYRIKEVVSPDGSILMTGRMQYISTRLGSEVCQSIDNLLQAVVTEGTGTGARGISEARGKTGTTQEGKSVWFCGYAKGIVGICWAGNERFVKKRNWWVLSPMPDSFGGDVCAPLWADAMGPIINKFGSDVKPDFSVVSESREPRRKKQEEEPVPEDDQSPTLRDEGDPVAPDDTAKPTRDPASNPGETPVELDPGESKPPVESEPPKTTPEKKKRDKPETDDSEVTVEVCADSGQLAGTYCPVTVPRKYKNSKRPRSKCRLHKAPSEGGDGTR